MRTVLVALTAVLALVQGEAMLEAVTGCLTEEDGRWFLTSATEPVRVDDVDEIPDPTAPGELRFRIVGKVAELDFPPHSGHKVRLEGIIAENDPIDSLDVTSLKHVAKSCP